MIRRCDTCKFWALGEEFHDKAQLEKHADDREGTCRRHAPSPVNYGFTYEVLRHLTHLSWKECSEGERETEFQDWEEAMFKSQAWPRTEGHDWCGEWREKDKQ
jgi:hypothetical protein